MSIPSLAPELENSLVKRWEPIYRSRLHYLVTWGTRGRRPVLRSRHLQALEALLQRVASERGFGLVEVAAAADHVHVLVGLKPTSSVASVVRELKGSSGMAMLTRFPELRVWLRANLMWDERYSVETVSAARLDHVRERLRAMHGGREELRAAG